MEALLWTGNSFPPAHHDDDVLAGRCQLKCTGGKFVPSTLGGHDAQHAIQDVAFENLRIHGKPITTLEEGKIHINAYLPI